MIFTDLNLCTLLFEVYLTAWVSNSNYMVSADSMTLHDGFKSTWKEAAAI
jgi:hypothetical protein